MTAAIPSLERIPLAMREAPRWMCYRFEPDPKHPEKPRKVPMRAAQIGVRASPTDPKTWATFNEAVAELAFGMWRVDRA